MKRKVVNWFVEDLDKERSQISFPEYQREKRLWSNEKKGLLIDSILRDIDIPKLYFNALKDKNIEVIDGQQRLWSIWDFLDNRFRYEGSGKAKLYREMTPDQRKKIKKYEFQVTQLEEEDKEDADKYLRMLFIRLQWGLLLVTGEKLNAATGKMKQLVFGKLTKHDFISHIGIPDRRFAKPTLCAQICINSFSRMRVGRFVRTRYDDLEQFFINYEDPKGEDLGLFNAQSKKIFEILDQLQIIFRGKAKNLRNRSYILSIYLFVEDRVNLKGQLSAKERKLFSEFILQWWKRLKEESRLGIDRENRELYSFQTLFSSAPGESYQIERRHKKLIEYYEHFKDTGKIVGY